jgi:hypothetical protein
MNKQGSNWAAVTLLTLLIGACGKPDEAVATKFDPKFIAAEADRGNLAPLTELNTACSAEIQKNGRRSEACAAQDEVRRLSKPLNIRF